jgi:TatD DNase family protein
MNYLFDTHCHLSDEEYRRKNITFVELVFRAKNNNVKFILNVGGDRKMNEDVMKNINVDADIYGSIGLHPNSEEDFHDQQLTYLEKNLKHKKILAIGEIGIDYYRCITNKEKQKD